MSELTGVNAKKAGAAPHVIAAMIVKLIVWKGPVEVPVRNVENVEAASSMPTDRSMIQCCAQNISKGPASRASDSPTPIRLSPSWRSSRSIWKRVQRSRTERSLTRGPAAYRQVVVACPRGAHA
jgi:hypothetical protein